MSTGYTLSWPCWQANGLARPSSRNRDLATWRGTTTLRSRAVPRRSSRLTPKERATACRMRSGLADARGVLADLNERRRLIDILGAVHLDGDERGDDEDQRQDEPLARAQGAPQFAQMHLAVAAAIAITVARARRVVRA